ncbi:MAG: DUF1329 domain-containing protein [Gammaproteobacteria bacterium]
MKINLPLISFVPVIVALSVFSGLLSAGEISRTEIDQWLQAQITVDAPPAGSVFDASNIAQLHPWIAPGLRDEFDFPEVTVEIQQTMDYPGHQSFQDASEKFAGQASLGPQGQLENYPAGKPFSDEQITSANPQQAGLMVGWNQFYRWQFMGYKVDELTMTYIDSTTGDAPLDENHGLLGGGNQTRRLTQSYHRVYLSKLPWLEAQDFRVDVPDSDTRFFKDYISFLSPFDVKGTSFVVERLNDPFADDQVNIYSPTERRVRRFSAKERADRFMGSEATLDDFEGFSGRVLDYNWRYLGKRKIIYVADSHDGIPKGHGPYSRLPLDQWQVRDCYVVEVKSILEDHPYGSRILFVDAQTSTVGLSLIFDHENNLWKTFLGVYQGPEPQNGMDSPMETSVQGWRGQFNVDRKTNNSTVVQSLTPTEHPHMKPAQIKRTFSVSNLTSGR